MFCNRLLFDRLWRVRRILRAVLFRGLFFGCAFSFIGVWNFLDGRFNFALSLGLCFSSSDTFGFLNHVRCIFRLGFGIAHNRRRCFHLSFAGGCFAATPLPEPNITAYDDRRCAWVGLPESWMKFAPG